MSRLPAVRRYVKRTVTITALIALIATGCGSATPESLSELEAEPVVTREPVARQIGDPTSTPLVLESNDAETSTVATTTTSTSTTTSTVPEPELAEATISVMGSIRIVPEDPTTVAEEDNATTDLAEITVATLGCAQSTGCDPGDIASWAANEIDVLNLATTAAALDGATALTEQSAALVASGVATVGFGPNLAAAATPAIIGAGAESIAIYAINLDEDLESSLVATDTSPGILGGESGLSLLFDQIAESQAAGHRVVVIVDFDRLDDRSPQANALEQTRSLVDVGVDAIVGHGSDFLQRFERLGETAVAFNLGNAATNSEQPLRRDTALFRFEKTTTGIVTCLLPATGGPEGVTIDDPEIQACE